VRILTLLTLLVLCACEGPVAEWMDQSVPGPTVFATDVVSTGEREYGITFTPDGREAYFTRRGPRGPSFIYVTQWVDGAWSEPVPAPFSLERDEAPFLTRDGRTMLFASRRPARGSWDRSENLWRVRRVEGAWSEPEPLPGTVNQPRSEIGDFSTGTEVGPFLTPSGSLLYWTNADPDWGSDIYVADQDREGAFVDPRPLRINSYGDETNPAMSPDGRYLFFQGARSEGFGDQDLYVSERTPYGWSDPRRLPEPVNTRANDGYPSFSPDGRRFFCASDRNERSGFYDIYSIDYEALRLDGGGVTR